MSWLGPHVCGETNHRFEGRYNVDEESGFDENAPTGHFKNVHNMAELFEAMKFTKSKSTYVHDVCVRCGLVIRREVLHVAGPVVVKGST